MKAWEGAAGEGRGKVLIPSTLNARPSQTRYEASGTFRARNALGGPSLHSRTPCGSVILGVSASPVAPGIDEFVTHVHIPESLAFVQRSQAQCPGV